MDELVIFIIPMAMLTALCSGGCIGLGLLGLVKRRPMVFSVRLLMWGNLLLCLLIAGSAGFGLFYSGGESDPIVTRLQVLQLLATPLIFLGLWLERGNYFIWGVTRESFQAALSYALNQQHLKWEGSLDKLRLTETQTEVITGVVQWSGAARLAVKRRPPPPVLREIALEIDAYYAATPIKMNYTNFIIMLAGGICMLLAFFGSLGLAALWSSRLWLDWTLRSITR